MHSSGYKMKTAVQFTQIIFDLDGTLSNPDEGIRHSIEYALRHMNIKMDVLSKFSRFIGPPLHEGFQHGLGLSEEQTEKAVYLFREYYGSQGVFENKLYPGVIDMLKTLKKNSLELHLATSKLEKYAIRVLDFHKIISYFSVISGATYKGRGADKYNLIQQVLKQRKDVSSDKFLMIGDKHFDVSGAKLAGIKSAGVLYGYGSEKELNDAGADYIISTVEELKSFLLKT